MVFNTLKESVSREYTEDCPKVKLWGRLSDGGKILYEDLSDYDNETKLLHPRKDVDKTPPDSQLQRLVAKIVWLTVDKTKDLITTAEKPGNRIYKTCQVPGC